MNEKAEKMVNKGRSIAKAGFDKGNEIMDKIPMLRSGRNKRIVWCALAVLIVIVVQSIFFGARDPFDVAKETMVAVAEGDLEIVLSNLYVPDEMKEKIAKLSDSEAEQVEKALIEAFVSSLSGLTDEQREQMVKSYRSMKCKEIKIVDNEAVVSVVVRKIDGMDANADIYLIKDNGDWKVDFNKTDSFCVSD